MKLNYSILVNLLMAFDRLLLKELLTYLLTLKSLYVSEIK